MRARDYAIAGAATAVLTAGSVAAVAVTGTPLHTSRVGMHRVVSTCSLPASLPGQHVTVMLSDMPGRGGMMGGRTMMLRPFPQTVRPGQVSFVAVNHGIRAHELVILPLPPGDTVGARTIGSVNTISESGSAGEASNTCGSGTGDGIRPGASGWVTVTLPRGRYELVCNLPGHYAAGMYAELDVA